MVGARNNRQFRHRTNRERERESTQVRLGRKGIPLGNLTSQLFANIYLNELDQFVKHDLKIKSYARYCDDMALVCGLGGDCRGLINQTPTKEIDDFLKQILKLELHPRKTIIRKPNQGMGFLGYVVFPHHKLLRAKTKKRMFKKIGEKRKLLEKDEITLKSFRQTIMSYMGACSHAEGFKIEEKLRKIYKEEYRGLYDRIRNKKYKNKA